MRLLPDTNEPSLRVAVIGMAMGCVWFAANGLLLAHSGNLSAGVVPLILFPPLALGLWRLLQWARLMALFILWFLVIMVAGPFGELSVFAEINGEAPPLPIAEQLMSRVAPFVIPALFFIEVLYAYGMEFSRGRVAEADARSSLRPMPPRSWTLWCFAVVAVPALMALLLEFAKDQHGGCIPFPTSNHSGYWKDAGVWHIPAIACVLVGLLAFMRATPVDASKINRIVRALIYSAGMLLFHGEIFAYVQYADMCHPG